MAKMLISLIAIASCVLVVCAADADEIDMGWSAGQQAGDRIRSELDSPEEINERTAEPLTSDSTAMVTFGPEDERQSFHAQLSAPSSDVFLEVEVQTNASGDLGTVSVRQDTNFDGNRDYVYNVPVPVSGVCANGVISCNPGTWENCRYYRWVAADNLQVSLSEESSIADLSACYCINNSCGGDLVWNNLGIILKDLGAGVVSAVQSRNAHCTITNVSTNGSVIRYYGQETSRMGDDYTYQSGPGAADGLYLSGSTNPEQYYETGTLPVEEERERQSNDPNSLYSLVHNSPSTNASGREVSCTVSRDIAFNVTNGPVFDGQVGTAGNNYWSGDYIQTISDIIELLPGVTVSSAHITYVGWDESIRIYVNGNLAWEDWPGCYERPDQYSNVWASVPSHYFNAGDNTLHAEICVRTLGEGWFGYHIETSKEDPYLTTNDQCHPHSSCHLRDEKVCDSDGLNCVQTWQSFNPTRLSPLPVCETVTSDIASYTVCMDGSTATVYGGTETVSLGPEDDMWWRIERVYVCDFEREYDYDDVLERTRHIKETTQDNGNSLYYEDYDPQTATSTPVTVDIPRRYDYESCEQACKLRKPAQDTQASEAGTTTDYRNTVDSYVFVYRKCEGNVCPVESGETVIKDCTCINDFQEAASMMQMLENAEEDLECDSYDEEGNCIGQIHIFTGSDKRCRSDGLTIGFDDCCKDEEYWFGLGECKEEEQELATEKAEGLCHYIGRYCSEELDLLFDTICIEHSRTYCCFNSKLARIVHEQGRPQLQGDISSWGDPENPNCRGFTPEEFQMLDFSRMDLSEWYEDIETKAQENIESEMEESIESFYDYYE